MKNIYTSIQDLHETLSSLHTTLTEGSIRSTKGLVGFDGFVDTFIRMRNPASMEEFGPKVAAAAGIAASYSVHHQGDKFGGNGPLFAAALHDIFDEKADVTYIGALGKNQIDPLFAEALESKTSKLFTLAPPAHSDCLEFSDGKIMLGDFDACDEITLDRLLEVMGQAEIDSQLQTCDFISAVNWGKLPNVGDIWSYLASRSAELSRTSKEILFFMDLAEFEHRDSADVQQLQDRLGAITRQCTTLLSFNLKEAWQMGDRVGGDFKGKKDPESVCDLAGLLREHLDVDKIIIHPNSGAACATKDTRIYVPGPHCKEPLISTGAGDNFGAGCVAAALHGIDETGMLLLGNATSGYFVRSGRTPTFSQLLEFLDIWAKGSVPERL
ncbi:MAG: PfkB family carbohydrate kinase [Kiritimatiellae bacterium]|jgi:hypothetical protein|nr:PfkB family carbohydrate kinase [Kiritimatiellia bacterium]